MTDLVPPPSTGTPAVEDRRGGTMYFTSIWRQWFISLAAIINSSPTGVSVTITTAKLTAGGTNGSMTFTNGILTSHVQAT